MEDKAIKYNLLAMAKTLIDYDRELSYLNKLPWDYDDDALERRTGPYDDVLEERIKTTHRFNEILKNNPPSITELAEVADSLRKFSRNSEYLRTARKWIIENLLRIDPKHPSVIKALLGIIENSRDYALTRHYAADSLGKIDPGNPKAIEVLVDLISTTDTIMQHNAIESLGEIGKGNPNAVAALVNVISSSTDTWILSKAVKSLQKIFTTPKQYAGVITALKDNLSDEVYQNNFNQFEASYEVIWNCAENLPYPEFYQAWHNPPTTPHPEVTEQTPHSGEQTFASPLTWESLQHLPLYCLNADPLADETREREIALTLSELIWEITCPDEDPPEPATPAELRRHLKTLKRRNLLPHRAILFGSETVSTPTQPTPEAIAFCQKLTGVIAIAFLTDDPLEAPLKGFPPNQRNLISAIETWLGEI
ncbi:HEAT repeat domain-containing protein [Limnospira sp. PMC 1042.18]|uniref:HEAT repeat domain-containing protein n=1 Tax=Limnospira sp. PMC 1042.18 TaxID=2981018 RepID=UPI0028E13E6A|nr:HEAT repeat domain-containing protein [Limnospira sp. PMC 1042.18]MDT9200098.1 HEAT repeat domain-containing protein [Limnospira sp. PMC 1042.18]